MGHRPCRPVCGQLCLNLPLPWPQSHLLYHTRNDPEYAGAGGLMAIALVSAYSPGSSLAVP